MTHSNKLGLVLLRVMPASAVARGFRRRPTSEERDGQDHP